MARKIRVLVVETYAPLRATLAQLLFSWGYEAETVSDGREALGKIASFDPEAIASGLHMPHMGGMGLLEALHHRMPCIIISADADAKEAIEAIRLGAFSVLEKPVGAERLHMDLRKCLDYSNTSASESEDRGLSECGVVSGQEVTPMPVKPDKVSTRTQRVTRGRLDKW